MAKGKRQHSRPPAGGIVRNDYHRRNRRRNVSTWNTSRGLNVQIERVTGEVVFDVPLIDRDELLQRARLFRDENAAKHGHRQITPLDRACVNYIRHELTNYDYVSSGVLGANYLRMFRNLMNAISDVYPWLYDECEYQYNQRSTQRKFKTIKVIKRTLTSQQVEDFNAAQESELEAPLTEEEEIPLFFSQLSSLAQERFLYLPPFLKREQVRERRFGEDANDRWWEWEEEIGLQSTRGRHNDRDGQL